MIPRTLLAGFVVAGAFSASSIMSGDASAQMLLCPEPPSFEVAGDDASAEAKQLLTRLTVALDLHGHRGIDENAIVDDHADIPNALLGKLGNVADQCAMQSSDLEVFYEALPGLRKSFLDAVGLPTVVKAADAEASAARDPRIKNASDDLTDAERVESAIDLSVRELWRKLWFRPTGEGEDPEDRWAVIVASPADAESGWDALGAHQQRWKDAYFQLHQPYYEDNPHHAIVIGRRLPREQAERLREYAIQLGMAEDTYIWPLPLDANVETPPPPPEDVDASGGANTAGQSGDDDLDREKLDLSVLQD